MSVLRHLKLKWFPSPLPPPGSYPDRRVPVTGGTAGMGLAAAVHLINLGAKEVIITARSAGRGEAAREKIEAQTGTAGQGRVKVMELDMNQYASIVALVERLKTEYSLDGLDYVVLNAGIHNVSFVESPTGL